MKTSWSRWNPLKPFGREKSDAIRLLEGALAGTLDCREWDSFLRIPMKGTPDLENVRLACVSLETAEAMSEDGKISYHEPARAEIQGMLQKLKTEPNQALQTMTIAVTSAAAHPPRQL
jgi:hypothetical protein